VTQASDTTASVRTRRSSRIQTLEPSVNPNKRKSEPSLLETSAVAAHTTSTAASAKSKRQKTESEFMDDGLGTHSKPTHGRGKAPKESHPVRRSARVKSAPLREIEATEEQLRSSSPSSSLPPASQSKATHDFLDRLGVAKVNKDRSDYAMESSVDSPAIEIPKQRKRKKESASGPSAVEKKAA